MIGISVGHEPPRQSVPLQGEARLQGASPTSLTREEGVVLWGRKM
eukprot:CAMPEP_0206272330 /NCGR_PEP_ID=MMETSP0047_2-20121206/33947_1 /ASSEMBLY_ACC=CAM_ASM_000192 /TAXON_ID=195065 /ORGANISM="Chroomonas mesostigmatica_cf, Strain CCMP1168" /LENGTH=44 /DNA_ID= /DNA_START= /DNA_END= /DNA_ORIENTATION=